MEWKDLPIRARASMEPAGIEVRYRCESGCEGALETEAFANCENGECTLETTFDGEVVEVRLVPKVLLSLTGVQVKLRHAFASDEMVLLNGFQSWTDTAERPAWARMRGLRGVPSVLVERYALDGGGDYAITDYSARRGKQHGFTYATFRRDEGMVLVGSLDEARGFTLIRTYTAIGEVLLEPEPPARVLELGKGELLGRFAIVRGTASECYDRWFELAGIVARPVKPLVGYTSWYRHYGDIDETKLSDDLEGARRFFDEGLFEARASANENGANGKVAGVEERRADADRLSRDAVKLFQIDDGYCKVGDWLDVDARSFPNGFAPLVERIRNAGFLPGLWVAPFVCERDSRLFTERNDWLLHDEAGELVPTGSHWSGGFALDTRNVEVRSYVLDVLQTMTKEWGFKLIKADFLYAACKYPHDGMNRGELMMDAVELLRKGVGDDTLILGCGVPLASAFGLFDYCRIGCDVGLDWNDLPHMRLLHRERVSTKNSLANTYARAPLDGRAFGNDPDVFFLRKGVRLMQAQRDELLFTDAELGSVLLTSDDMSEWGEAQRNRYRQALSILMGCKSEASGSFGVAS